MYRPWSGLLQPLKTASPSQANEMLEGCPLRVLVQHPINKGTCPAGLGEHPASAIGTALHQLEESARRGMDAWSTKQVDDELKRLLHLQEERLLAASPLNERLMPLAQHQYFKKRRFRAIQDAKAIRDRQTTGNEEATFGSGSGHRLFGSEVTVWDLEEDWPASLGMEGCPEGVLVKGSVDLVELVGNSVHISDLKSGDVLDALGEVKSAYRTQILLYAALWIRTARYRHAFVASEENITLQLRGYDGQHDIELGNHEHLLQEVRQNLLATRERIDTNSGALGHLASELAVPNARNCQYCRHRTGCEPYHTEMLEADLDQMQPFDLAGVVVVSPFPISDDARLFQLRLRDSRGLVWLVDQLDARFVDLERFQVGARVGVFGGEVVEGWNQPGVDRAFRCLKHTHVAYPRC